MTLNFTALDFETANEQRASVCAVGVTQVRDGFITSSASWLVLPPTGPRFTNTHVHGITWEQARAGASWAASVDAIRAWIGEHPVVSYGASFDMSVFEAASNASGVPIPDIAWIDILESARDVVTLSSYSLPDVAEHLGIGLDKHHHAESDAKACAAIALALAQHSRIITPAESTAPKRPRRTTNGNGGQAYPGRTRPLPKPDPDADTSHPLYGVSITFTGELTTLTRDDARQLAADRGAHVTTVPTRKTRIVVLGAHDPATLSPGATMSAKLTKAHELRASGQAIDFIDEAQFMELVSSGHNRGPH